MTSATVVITAIVAVAVCSIVRSWMWARVVSDLLESQSEQLDALRNRDIPPTPTNGGNHVG